MVRQSRSANRAKSAQNTCSESVESNRLELGVEIELLLETPRVPHEPVAPRPGPVKRLGVRLGQGAPGGGANVHDEDRGLEALPGGHQRPANGVVSRGGFLEHRGHRLTTGVRADAPAVGQLAAGLEAVEIEGRSHRPLEGHREEIGHRLGWSEVALRRFGSG